MAHPAILFGASSVGEGQFQDEKSKELLTWLSNNGVRHFDTAALYPATSPGKSEEVLGSFQRDGNGKIDVDTKILLTDFSGKGSLEPEAIDKSIAASATRLPGGISTLYCHLPDPATPVLVTAKALDRHFAEKQFKRLGLSNFQTEQVTEFVQVCDQNQLLKPSIYQGQYNALSRDLEKSLIPTLRQHGISFMAYSPLAGGFLTGNFTNGRNVVGTRFDDGHRGAAQYKMLYDKPEMHSAVKTLERGCGAQGLGLSEAALRWLYHHSELREGDGIILGATKLHQVQQNLEEIRRGPLSEDLVRLFDDAWEDVRAAAAK